MELQDQPKNTTRNKPKLLDQVRAAIQKKHYSIRTEESYISWIKRFVKYHGLRHPGEMGEAEIQQFLNHLAVKEKVAASTQNQALCAIIFLYTQVLKQEVGTIENIVWAKKPKKLPVVFTRKKAQAVLNQLSGMNWLMGMLLYGSGLRLTECLQLRVKDIDFEYKQITIHNAKGGKDRVTPLPERLIDPLKEHLKYVKELHEKDLKEGFTSVYLPYALERKYPNAGKEFGWKFIFPATKISKDPRSGILRRHHIHESVLQKAVKQAIRKAGITKQASCHTFTP